MRPVARAVIKMLKSLSLKNFTVFKNTELLFTPGINVLIGVNATGKTHAMKAAYALLRAARDYETKGARGPRRLPCRPIGFRKRWRACSGPKEALSGA